MDAVSGHRTRTYSPYDKTSPSAGVKQNP